ncbi:MAG: hypothetical protein HQM10_16235 [Candidatus Riflebacteria bacterium]|nr:hypothetical protein [Candidatus Riflebacteria bacterium]
MNNFDMESELLNKLKSSKRSIIVDALIKLSKSSPSAIIMAEIAKLAATDDREISMFAKQAESRIKSRMTSAEHSNKIPHTTLKSSQTSSKDLSVAIDKTSKKVSESEKSLESLSLAELFELLDSAANSSISSGLINQAPTEKGIDKFCGNDLISCIIQKIRVSPENVQPELRTKATEFLANHGQEDDFTIIFNWISSTEGIAAFQYFEFLEKISPNILLQKLPSFLSSSFPLLRGRAVKSLYKIDPAEAIEHIAELLASSEAEERYIGATLCFSIPFSNAFEMILPLLQTDTDKEVLKALETLIVSNPDIETAFSLLNIMDVLPPQQKKYVMRIFSLLSSMLRDIGVIASDGDPAETIQLQWKTERLKAFLEDLEIQLFIADKSKRNTIKEWLSTNIALPEVEKFVEKLAFNRITEDIARDLLKKNSDVPAEDASVKPSSPYEMRPSEKVNFIRTINKTAFPEIKDWLKKEALQGTSKVRYHALMALTNLSTDPADLSTGWSALESEDTLICQAGFDLVAKYDPDSLFIKLPELFSRSFPGLNYKITCFSLKHNKSKAVELILGLLNSRNPLERAMVLPSIFFLPFDSVKSKLLEALNIESHPEIAAKIILILLANPSMEILESLDTIKNKKNPSIDVSIAKARNELHSLLHSLNLLKPHTPKKHVSAQLPTTISTTVQSSAVAVPVQKPYSAASVRQEIRKHREAAWRPPELPDAGNRWWQRTDWLNAIFLGLGLATLTILPIAFLKKADRVDIPQKEIRQKATSDDFFDRKLVPLELNCTMGKVSKISATLNSIDKNGLLRVTYGKTVFLIKPPEKMETIAAGQSAYFEILPYRKLKSGEILADGYSVTNVK